MKIFLSADHKNLLSRIFSLLLGILVNLYIAEQIHLHYSPHIFVKYVFFQSFSLFISFCDFGLAQKLYSDLTGRHGNIKTNVNLVNLAISKSIYISTLYIASSFGIFYFLSKQDKLNWAGENLFTYMFTSFCLFLTIPLNMVYQAFNANTEYFKVVLFQATSTLFVPFFWLLLNSFFPQKYFLVACIPSISLLLSSSIAFYFYFRSSKSKFKLTRIPLRIIIPEMKLSIWNSVLGICTFLQIQIPRYYMNFIGTKNDQLSISYILFFSIPLQTLIYSLSINATTNLRFSGKTISIKYLGRSTWKNLFLFLLFCLVFSYPIFILIQDNILSKLTYSEILISFFLAAQNSAWLLILILHTSAEFSRRFSLIFLFFSGFSILLSIAFGVSQLSLYLAVIYIPSNFLIIGSLLYWDSKASEMVEHDTEN